MSIRWENIPGRFWLWRHQNHEYHNLTGSMWSCSCDSYMKRPAR